MGKQYSHPHLKVERRRRQALRRSEVRRRPSGRQRHDEKITVYLSSDELVALDEAKSALYRDLGMKVDRGRIVREAVAVVRRRPRRPRARRASWPVGCARAGLTRRRDAAAGRPVSATGRLGYGSAVTVEPTTESCGARCIAGVGAAASTSTCRSSRGRSTCCWA